MNQGEVEKRIAEMFEENYQLFLLAGGHALTHDVKQLALHQVIAYYLKLKNIAENVSESEIKLILPNEVTPNGNRFNIEGIVDIVQENEETWMYDIKTHEADYIRTHTDQYEGQLNVYGHIWQNLRQNKLDHTAIISTALPEKVKTAFRFGDEAGQELTLKDWDPVIEIDYRQENVEETIAEFANVVDDIEDRYFSAPEVKILKQKVDGINVQFANYVCQNCDARYSCPSYRDYARQSGAKTQADLGKYLEETGDAVSNEERILAGLDKTSEETGEE